MQQSEIKRCPWCLGDPIYVRYHDEEWGVPVYEDRKIFEFIILESAQAGLSWLTILRKRLAYHQVFARFDMQQVAAFSEETINAILLSDYGIIRNRMKVEAAVRNARACLRIVEEYGSLSNYFWQFTSGKPLVNKWKDLKQVPAETSLSVKIARDLKKWGFTFFGPKIVYAHLQATGIVNDHLVDCFRYHQLIQNYG